MHYSYLMNSARDAGHKKKKKKAKMLDARRQPSKRSFNIRLYISSKKIRFYIHSSS